MQAQAMRKYQITFSGRDTKGVLPMFTCVQAMTGKGAGRAFIARHRPLQGLFLGDPEDVTHKVNKEAETADKAAQK